MAAGGGLRFLKGGGLRGGALKGGGVKLMVNDAEVRRALATAADAVQPAAEDAMDALGELLVLRMRTNLVRHRKVDRGANGGLLDSISHKVEGRGTDLSVTAGPDERYKVQALTIENGRRPGSKMPPPGALLGWMSRHNIPAEAEFVVRRAIGRNGLRGQPFPFMAPAVEEGQKNLDAIFREVSGQVMEAFDRG